MALNFQVQAAQLGEAGAAISEISKNYDHISLDLKDSMQRFVDSADRVRRTINDGRFLASMARIQKEVQAVFDQEREGEDEAHALESRYLSRQQGAYACKAHLGLEAITAQAEGLRQDCEEMPRLSAGLDVTRIMGKVESSRLDATSGALNELLDDLESLQAAVANGLKEIGRLNLRIKRDTELLLGDAPARAA